MQIENDLGLWSLVFDLLHFQPSWAKLAPLVNEDQSPKTKDHFSEK